jgi:2-polyprenylphenol 6-hydroxylase
MKSFTTTSKKCDVIILGGGSVGLSLALMLLKQGLQVKLVDRRPLSSWSAPQGFDPRVYALNAQSCALLEECDAWKFLDTDRIGIIKEMEVWGDDNGQLRFGDRKDFLAKVVEDGAIQNALRTALNESFGHSWFMLDEAESIQTHAQDITLQLKQNQAITTSLLVGADGSQSWLRHALNWDVERHDYQQQGIVMNLSCSESHLDIARQWFIDGEIIALLPLGGHQVSLVWSAHQMHASQLLAGNTDSLLGELRNLIGEPLGSLTALTQAQGFPLSLVKVSKIAGEHCALIGDAAHGVHPLAGQGLNLGFADAECLARVIAERGLGPPTGDQSVLRRYARSRALPVFLMQGITNGLHGLFAKDDPILRPLRNMGMNMVNHLPILKSLLVANASGSQPS